MLTTVLVIFSEFRSKPDVCKVINLKIQLWVESKREMYITLLFRNIRNYIEIKYQNYCVCLYMYIYIHIYKAQHSEN